MCRTDYRHNGGQEKLRETCAYPMIFDVQGEHQRVVHQMSDALVSGTLQHSLCQTPYHTAITPPSSTMVVPLMYAESSQARKTATLPTSAGRPSRCTGVRAISCMVLSASTNP